ncbi:PAXNEB-domain-containing protein [Lindgomyces ingoldianus]|uniref:PAXNEB-domain-containing protein n=1 Tax=Lindgomyces ingoldianus TaxID=673940 RepID=A0ACB6R4Z1_9PLEO|nr:PAXNEB-domain-containing protein [Lindgomyces ingoldianus]KAF2473845.1 PAXNEB-domain-containing protein [Lindgomyces ingoldianus]
MCSRVGVNYFHHQNFPARASGGATMAFRKRNVAVSRSREDEKCLALPIASPEQTRPGTRPSPIDGRPTTSTGTPSLDNILAGHAGLPLGNSILIGESGTTDYAGALLRFYAAEGIVQGHQVHVVGMGEAWGRELPGLAVSKDDERKEKREKMKIAWRYEGLGQFENARGPGLPTSARGSPQAEIDNPEEPAVFCHTFDLARRLALPAGTTINYISIPRNSQTSLFTPVLRNIQHQLASSQPSTIHRLVIPSILSPTLYPPEASHPSSVLQFLHALRALLRQHSSRLTALITIPLSLYPRSVGLVRWMEIISDGVLELSPFPYDPTQPLSVSGAATQGEEKPQGLLVVHKLPVFHEKGGGGGAHGLGEDFSFTVSRRKFVISKFSLPPVEGDRKAQEAAATETHGGGMPSKAELDMSSISICSHPACPTPEPIIPETRARNRSPRQDDKAKNTINKRKGKPNSRLRRTTTFIIAYRMVNIKRQEDYRLFKPSTLQRPHHGCISTTGPAMVPIVEPFPISYIAGRYLLFDVDAVSHARREHNICGVLIGTIPNLSQQNVFLGIPLELMPEEARVLVEQGHAYIVDDVEAHRSGFLNMSREDRLALLQVMDEKGIELAISAKQKAEARSEKALKDRGLDRIAQANSQHRKSPTPERAGGDATKIEAYFLTPTTSHSPPLNQSVHQSLPLPEVPRSYPLFRYLHSKGFFSTPGLRFGCHYTVYPGDPLRFHSHFLVTGLDWEEEFDLLDIVGGGRLGTGVKKAYLIGGEEPSHLTSGTKDGSVRAFSIEWAGL